MKTYRIHAVLAGVLYIIGTVTGILSLVVTRDLLAGENVLNRIAANPSLLRLGAFFIFLMGISLAAMPIFLYPVFKKKSEALALGMVIFRGPLEGSTYILYVVNWILLGLFSKEFAALGAEGASLQAVGNVMLQANDIMGHIFSIVFTIGALFLYLLFYLTRLIPRWLSGWGLLGAVLYMIVYLLKFFSFQLNLDFLIIPLAVQEMAMALWLIIKGFNQTALARLMESEAV